MTPPASSPLPTLRIHYNTALVSIPEPRLYHTLNECEGVIASRQRKIAAFLDVTIMDTGTNQVITHYPYPQEALPMELLYYQVRAEWIHEHTALVNGCGRAYKDIRRLHQTYGTLLWYTSPDHPRDARRLAFSHLTAIRVELTRARHHLDHLREALAQLALTRVPRLPLPPHTP